MVRKYNEESSMPIEVMIFALIMFMVIVLSWIQANQEADTYNKLTGANVTAWDALWIDLRVQDSAVQGKAKTP